MKYCQQCGTPMEDDQSFCTQCGAASEEASSGTVIDSSSEGDAPSASAATQALDNAASSTSPVTGKLTTNPFTGAPLAGAPAATSAPSTTRAMPAPVVPQAASPASGKPKKKWLPILIIAIVAIIAAVLAIVVITQLGGQDTAQDRAEKAVESTAAATVQYSTYYVANCKESIAMREAPNTDSPAIAQVPFGAPVSVVEVAENGFYKVEYDNKTGYVLSTYLSATKQDAPPQSNDAPSTDVTYKTMYVVNCNEWITLRTAPSTSASEITKIPLGEPVSYIESAADGFYKISYLGQTGYALASYLGDSPASSSKPATSTVYYRVVNCDEWISLRKSPSTSADRYCTIPLGSTVAFYGNAGNGFLKVGYDGYVGYALASYLTPA